MNFQNLNFDYVEQQQTCMPLPNDALRSNSPLLSRGDLLAHGHPLLVPPPRYPPGGPRTPSNHSDATLRDPEAGHVSSNMASPSSRETIVPHRPVPPSTSTSTSEIYGPDRIFGPPLIPPSSAAPPSSVAAPLLPESPPTVPPASAFPWPAKPHTGTMDRRTQLEEQMNASMLTQFRDDLVREACTVTPGVDETPYLQYAIEALTRDRDTGYSGNDTSSTNPIPPIPPVVFDRGLGYYQQPSATTPQAGQQWQQQQQQQQQPTQAHSRRSRGFGSARTLQPLESLTEEDHLGFPRRQTLGPDFRAPLSNAETLQPNEWVPISEQAIVESIGLEKAGTYPPLDFLPWILRPISFAVLILLCVLMIAALIACAVSSQMKHGLTPYAGTIHGGQYFVFRMLPQLLAAVIFSYSQFVVTTMFRIRPFVLLASDDPGVREGALFQDLYPTTFLWPQLLGGWGTWLPILTTWLIGITLPLQSSLFTVILVDGAWVWATVQGVAWTLVALYVTLLAAMAIAMLSWSRITETGLLWDPRSIADTVVAISETNTAADYYGTQLAGTRDRLRFALRRRHGDRLGYWTWRDGRPEFWYGLGHWMGAEKSSAFPDNYERLSGNADREKGGSAAINRDAEAASLSPEVRHRYLPWCMRSGQLGLSVLVFFVLLMILFIVSFRPSTRLTSGFLPMLPAAPTTEAFSPADFLYSFLPSLLGLLLYLFFQTLEISFRILQPWAALSNERGAEAGESLLADYASCAPFQGALHAAKNHHWRLAAVSLLSPLFLLLPVLAGGMFMALTRLEDGQVRMFPNVPALAILLTLLVLYLAALVSLLPRRRPFRLPHAVACLAEVVSFLANDDLLRDQAFKACRAREEMIAAIGLDGGVRWAFGITPTDGMPGVSRARRRYTERRRVRKSQIRLGRDGRGGLRGE